MYSSGCFEEAFLIYMFFHPELFFLTLAFIPFHTFALWLYVAFCLNVCGWACLYEKKPPNIFLAWHSGNFINTLIIN